MYYFNTSEQSWSRDPYMVKEHTVYENGLAATVVIVPVIRHSKDGEEKVSYLKMGVRIEDIRSRPVHGNFTLPGYTYFYKYKTGKVSETSPYQFKQDRCGGLDTIGSVFPALMKPHTKYAGEELEKHRMKATIERLIRLAGESYAAWMEEKRQAA